MNTTTNVQSRVEAMARAAMTYPTISADQAHELARNAATSLLIDEQCGLDTDAAAVAFECLIHRMAHGWIYCPAPELVADRMGAAWVKSREEAA